MVVMVLVVGRNARASLYVCVLCGHVFVCRHVYINVCACESIRS